MRAGLAIEAARTVAKPIRVQVQNAASTNGAEGRSRTIANSKAALLKTRRAFIEHLQRLEAEGCLWLVVPLAEDESSGLFKCSKCEAVAPDAAPLYSLATHIAFEQEIRNSRAAFPVS